MDLRSKSLVFAGEGSKFLHPSPNPALGLDACASSPQGEGNAFVFVEREFLMKPISSALEAHLAGELTTLAYLVKITRTDGVIKGFTTFDQNLVISGVTYKADGALTPSALQSSSGLATDNLEVTGILNSADIVDADIEGRALR